MVVACSFRQHREQSGWRPPRKALQPSPALNHSACRLLALAINLDRRRDRLEALCRLQWSLPWERLPAVDGRHLSWPTVSGMVHAQAVRDAEWADNMKIPTICRYASTHRLPWALCPHALTVA